MNNNKFTTNKICNNVQFGGTYLKDKLKDVESLGEDIVKKIVHKKQEKICIDAQIKYLDKAICDMQKYLEEKDVDVSLYKDELEWLTQNFNGEDLAGALNP